MDIRKLKQRILANSRQYGTALLVAGLVAVGGILKMGNSFAATFVAGDEVENGVVAGNASVQSSQTGASGSASVLFSDGVVTPPGDRTCPAWPAIPDANCTGVPSGYSLASSGDLGSTTNGQTIDGKLVNGSLTINNNNVTISNTRVKGRIYIGNHTGTVIKDTDVGFDSCPASSGGSGQRAIVGGDGYTLLRTRVHTIDDDLLSIGGGNDIVIQDSIIKDTCFYAGDHLDAIQWYDPGAVGHVSVIHSDVDVRPVNNSDKGNSALFWADGAGSGTLLTMYHNRLAGGQVTTALYDAVKNSGTVLDVHDNVYIKNSYAGAPCSFGTTPKSIVFDGTSGVKFTNNKFDDGTDVSCD